MFQANRKEIQQQNSALELLYRAYAGARPAVNRADVENFEKLDQMLNSLSNEKQDDIFDVVYRIYTENERSVFTAGVRIGVRLAEELRYDGNV